MLKRCCSPRPVFASAGWGFGKGPEGARAQILVKFNAASDSFQYCSLGRWLGSCAFQKSSAQRVGSAAAWRSAEMEQVR